MITNPNAPTVITPEILATMDTGLAALRSGCAELPNADAALLRRAAKMGLKSETFSREAIELAKQNLDLCPAGIDLEQAERTMAIRDSLLSRYLQARQLAETLEVAMQVCGVDVFDTARTAYKSMKANCRDAALLELIDHLGRNFRSRRAEKTSESVVAPSANDATISPRPAPSIVAGSGAGPVCRTTQTTGGDRQDANGARNFREGPISPLRPRRDPPSARHSVQNGHGKIRRRIYWINSPAPIRSRCLLSLGVQPASSGHWEACG